MNKCSLIIRASSVLESLEVIIFWSKIDNNNFIITDRLLQCSSINKFGRRSASLVNPVDDFIFCSSSIVFSGFSIHKPFKSWVSLYSELLSKIRMYSCINLSDVKRWILCSKNSSSCCVFWGKFLTVSTPWGVEFYKEFWILCNCIIEVILSQYEDSVFFFNLCKTGKDGKC